jgi:hypothetical protein
MPLGSLTELFSPPALPGPAGMPLTPASAAPWAKHSMGASKLPITTKAINADLPDIVRSPLSGINHPARSPFLASEQSQSPHGSQGDLPGHDAAQHTGVAKLERVPASSRHFLIASKSVYGWDSVRTAMTFTIHASKNGQSVTTVRIIPAVAVDKARVLEGLGWQVHVTDSAGRQFDPSDFDRLSSLADERV